MRMKTERAFTMIEMVVAMTMLVVVLMLGSIAFIKSLDSSRSQQKNRAAATRARDAFSQFRTDFANSRADGRAPTTIGSSEELQRGLLHGTPIKRNVGGVNVVLDVRDVIVATQNEFIFRSDAMPKLPGVECVRYLVDPTPPRKLLRQVMPYVPNSATGRGACGASILESTELFQGVS